MKKIKRYISLLIMTMMLVSCLTVTAFAQTQQDKAGIPNVPDAVALVTVDNVDCKVFNDIKDLSVTIRFKDSGKLIATIPVVKVENTGDDDSIALWLGYEPEEAVLDEVKDAMSEIQKDFHCPTLKELVEMLSNASEKELENYLDTFEKTLGKITDSYTVELTGLPEAEDHEYKYEADVMILNSQLVNEVLTFCKDMIGQLFELSDAELANITSFSSMMDVINQKLVEFGLLEQGEDLLSMLEESSDITFTTEEKAQIEEALAEIDAILDYMKSEAYKGTVIAGVEVTCGCPHLMQYSIVHQYFKVTNGEAKLVGTVYEGDCTDEIGSKYYEQWEGFTVKASDYMNCSYNGTEYQYIGSYDALNEFIDDSDVQYFYKEKDNYYDKYEKLESYTLDYDSDSFETGILLCYEIVENTDASPSTGDDTDLGIYFGIMMFAAAVMVATCMVRRKKC